VRIPLLRDDVRASRTRSIVAAAALGIAVVAVLSAVVVPRYLSPAAEPPRAAAAPSPPETIEDDAGAPAPAAVQLREEPLPSGEGTRTVHAFGQARAFRSALTSAGCTGQEADALVTALSTAMDFRRCRPEHELALERGPNGVLSRFEYRASATQIYEAIRGPDGRYEGRQVEVPIERARLARAGTIRSSLGTALERAGLGRTLVGVFVEVFEGQVDFNTDTRAGDTFRILVDEERIEGQLLRYGTVHAIEIVGQRTGRRRAYWHEHEGNGDFYDATGRAVHGGWLRTPLR
ncbi:MAG: hypothetical protein IT378_00175, partial [Sandaracinaceae bacterium]|nr:hypothetical protein [Sandaracinaceae bacterium]